MTFINCLKLSFFTLLCRRSLRSVASFVVWKYFLFHSILPVSSCKSFPVGFGLFSETPSQFLYHEGFFLFSLDSFRFLSLILRALIHFGLIFEQGERQRFSLILPHVESSFPSTECQRPSFLQCGLWVPIEAAVNAAALFHS